MFSLHHFPASRQFPGARGSGYVADPTATGGGENSSSATSETSQLAEVLNAIWRVEANFDD